MYNAQFCVFISAMLFIFSGFEALVVYLSVGGENELSLYNSKSSNIS